MTGLERMFWRVLALSAWLWLTPYWWGFDVWVVIALMVFGWLMQVVITAVAEVRSDVP